MSEVWKPIKGYECIYEVSSLGRLRSVDRTYEQVNRFGTMSVHSLKGKILSPKPTKAGYLRIGLRPQPDIRNWHSVHRLVAEAFIPNPDNLPQVNHKDENKQNNNVSNLEWCTASYNSSHGTVQSRRYQNGGGKRKKKVGRYNEDGKLLSQYESIAEASSEFGINYMYLSDILNGKNGNFAKGYYWRIIY